ncbi:MAG: epoxyqueuosine reductase [Candidatus Delongbacteria bacterium]|nr:epoxyqueuosine reductase [Candidatus Delongbacteria bacterium]
MMKYINKDINVILKNEMVDYIGYAQLEKYEAELIKFGGDLIKGYKYGISIGIALPNSIVNQLPNRFDSNVACAYKNHAYNIINERLNLIASKLSSYLNKKGYQTLPITAADRTNEEDAIPTVSHKMIAHIAGLGWIGKNCLLITPKHGPRVRFISLLTNAPLKAVDNPVEQKCKNCTECMKICPAQAIKGVNYELGRHREDRFDFSKCQAYFEQLKEKYKWNVCGMCLYICPFGKKY